jgi:proteasome component ECM29
MLTFYSFSALEPQELNYLSFHTESYNISQDQVTPRIYISFQKICMHNLSVYFILQLDSARLMGTKNSPMMEGIEQCIKQIDEDVMREVSPRVLHTIRTGTGLPTKVRTCFNL